MVLANIVLNGLFYSIVGSSYLLIIMIIFSPRIWGYQDYPERIKKKVPAQTRRERSIAGFISVPWFIFIIVFPFVSTSFLKPELNHIVPFEIAFINIFFMVSLFYLVDLVILDWLIISKITPKFVIIAGTTPEDYKDFSHHYKRQLIAFIPITILCIVFSAIFVFIQ